VYCLHVCLVSTVSGLCKNTHGRASASSKHITKLEQSTFLRYLRSRWKPWNINWRGRLSTDDLLIEVACFVAEVNNVCKIKMSYSKLLSTRRSIVSNRSSPFIKVSLIFTIEDFDLWNGRRLGCSGASTSDRITYVLIDDLSKLTEGSYVSWHI